MPILILDSSVLIDFYRKRHRKWKGPVTVVAARSWAMDLLKLHQTYRSQQATVSVVTPVVLEVVAGARNRLELSLYRAFLDPFPILDDHVIPAADWRIALRLAERVPRNGKPRQLGDCLISAIAKRLKCEVVTKDTSFPK